MHTHAVQYGIPWVTGGKVYSIGRGCNGVSYAFPQCGYIRGFTSVRGMYAELLLQIWENLVGVLRSCILINMG